MNLSRRNFIKIAGLSAAAVAGAALFTGCSGQLMLPVRFSATVIGKDIQKALDTKQFSVVAKPGETIEYRRQRLLSKYNTIVPFSIGFLRDRLQELFSSDYTMQVSPGECTITISVTSSRYGAVDLLYDLLWDIVPAHIKIIANQQVNNYISGALTAAGIMSGTFVQTI